MFKNSKIAVDKKTELELVGLIGLVRLLRFVKLVRLANGCFYNQLRILNGYFCDLAC